MTKLNYCTIEKLKDINIYLFEVRRNNKINIHTYIYTYIHA